MLQHKWGEGAKVWVKREVVCAIERRGEPQLLCGAQGGSRMGTCSEFILATAHKLSRSKCHVQIPC